MNQLPTGEKKPFRKLDEGDLNRWIFNPVMAFDPFIRYIASLMYLSKFNGLSRISSPDSEFMRRSVRPAARGKAPYFPQRLISGSSRTHILRESPDDGADVTTAKA